MPGALKDELDHDLMRKIQACLDGLQRHRRPSWDGGELFHMFLTHARQETLVYPVAVGHALVAGYHVYLHTDVKYHVFNEGWAEHVKVVVVRHLCFQSPNAMWCDSCPCTRHTPYTPQCQGAASVSVVGVWIMAAASGAIAIWSWA